MEESKKRSDHKLFKKHLIACGLFALLAIAFTILVKTVGVGNVSVSDRSGEVSSETVTIGFSAVNSAFHNFLSYNDTWYKITKYSGYLLVIPVATFIVLAIYQLIKRKSLKKVDRELKLLALFYVAVAAIYLIFEKLIIINYRPILLDGTLEPSYPSSHTLFAMCFCCSAMMLTGHFLKNKKLAVLVNLALTALLLVTVIGRLISGVHWLTDILGGIFISASLLFLLATFLQHKPHAEKVLNKQ